eukprot:2545490-Amphidinium_carterae.2
MHSGRETSELKGFGDSEPTCTVGRDRATCSVVWRKAKGTPTEALVHASFMTCGRILLPDHMSECDGR